MKMTEQVRNLLSVLLESELEFKVLPSENTVKVSNYTVLTSDNTVKVSNYTITYRPDVADFSLRQNYTHIGTYSSAIELVTDILKDGDF